MIRTYTKKIKDWDAVVTHDLENNMYIIHYSGNGGAVMSGRTYEIAEKRFIEAMMLSEAIYKLNYFSKHGMFPEQAN